MEIEQDLLEPLKIYQYELSYKHQDTIDNFFNELTTKSGVDTGANEITCREYYGYVEQIKNHKKKLDSQKGLRTFLIIMTVLAFIAGTIMIIFGAMQTFKPVPLWIGIGALLVLVGIALIVLNSSVIAKKVGNLNQKIAELQQKADEKLAMAKSEMAALNNLFDWCIPARLLNKTTPIIKMDDYFSAKRYSHMVQNYGMKPANEDNVSTIFAQSGTLLDNPFVYERDYVQNMIDKEYRGSIVITWTTWTTDSKGNSRTVTHTQTLVATVTKPAANFFLDTALIYANEAAPRLSFSRIPSNANSMNEKDLQKFEAQWDKKLHKMQEDKIKQSFTPLSNSKFEGLFNALDRDNEVEFRLLFTPLAQKNMISLITSKKPYGDDFRFVKRKMINVIRSDHAQSLDFDGNPYHFKGFDYNEMKNRFTNYNMRYFQGIFYDFAPLLSIPLYQQHRDYDWVDDGSYKANNTTYEAEVLANFMDEEIFRPEDCDTHLILKATPAGKVGKLDIFNIHSYGFHKEPRVDIVSKMGGDGHLHQIPVNWEEYIEVSKDTPIAVIYVGGSRNEFLVNKEKIAQLVSSYHFGDDIIYQRGLLAFPLMDDKVTINEQDLIKMFSHKEA